MRHSALMLSLALCCGVAATTCMDSRRSGVPIVDVRPREPAQQLRQYAFVLTTQWIVCQDRIERISKGRTSEFLLSSGEETVDSLALSEDVLLVLTSTRLLRICFEQHTLKAHLLIMQKPGRLTYSLILGEGREIWLYGGSSVHRIANQECVASSRLAMIAGESSDLEFVTEPLFADRIGSTFYFVTRSRKGGWRYWVYDTHVSQWVMSRDCFDSPGPLVMHKGRVWQLSGMGYRVSFPSELSQHCLVDEGEGSMRGLYVRIGSEKYLSQCKVRSVGPLYICLWDFQSGEGPRQRLLFPTQYSEPVYICYEKPRVRYWPVRMSFQEPTTYVTWGVE